MNLDNLFICAASRNFAPELRGKYLREAVERIIADATGKPPPPDPAAAADIPEWCISLAVRIFASLGATKAVVAKMIHEEFLRQTKPEPAAVGDVPDADKRATRLRNIYFSARNGNRADWDEAIWLWEQIRDADAATAELRKQLTDRDAEIERLNDCCAGERLDVERLQAELAEAKKPVEDECSFWANDGNDSACEVVMVHRFRAERNARLEAERQRDECNAAWDWFHRSRSEYGLFQYAASGKWAVKKLPSIDGWFSCGVPSDAETYDTRADAVLAAYRKHADAAGGGK